MKKLLIILSFMIVLVFSGKAQYTGDYYLEGNGPHTGARITWVYSFNGGVDYYFSYSMALDSNYIMFPQLSTKYPVNNTNTRLLAVNDTGSIQPFDITALPKQTLSINSKTISISNGNSIVLPAETDPIWDAQKSAYSTKVVADGLYKNILYTPTLSISGASVSAGGNTIVLPDASSSNELQTLSINVNTVTILSGNSIVLPTYNQTLSINSNTVSISNGNSIVIPTGSVVYTNTATTTSGNAVFYLTNDKTSTGTALYTSVPSINPIINDASTNYTYGWTLSPDFKTLTVNSKSSPGLVVGLLTLLGVPVNVANGTVINVLTIK